MTTYYVSPSGNDANDGLGADASQSSKPWLTLGKALGASGISSGDTVYIAPGTYREVVTVAMTSAVAETSVLGDPANAQGFKDGSGALLSSGEIIWTAYTNDTTAPSASDTLDLAGRDYLTFRHITFIGGTGFVIDAVTQTSTNITVRDCDLYSVGTLAAVNVDGAFGTSLSWLIERCIFYLRRTAYGLRFQNDGGSGADYDLDFTIRNCLAVANGAGNAFCYLAPSGAAAQNPGGIDIYNCTITGAQAALQTVDPASTTIPCVIYNCIIQSARTGASLNAGTSGQIVENYNYIDSSTTHTNVTQGGNTITGTARAPNWHIGEERLVGAQPRMFMEPKAGSWMLTFGNDGTYTTSEDFLGLPRPGGGASVTKGIGYLGRGNTFTKETGTVHTGSSAISFTGPAVQDVKLPVDATSTTVTVYARFDGSYTGTKPQMKVLGGGECGVTDNSVTATGSANTWEQLSLNFTPARVGQVTIRLQSNDTSGAGVCYFDTFAVA